MNELPVSHIQVLEVVRLTPHMARITFTGFGDSFTDEPDQQVKLYFPKPGQSSPRMPSPSSDFMSWYQAFNAIPEEERPWMRSFTVRSHSADTVTIDFVLHGDEGPASQWALSARPGDTLARFGPSQDFARRTSLHTSVAEADWVLLAGDETALPAIGSILESLPSGARAVAYIEVRDGVEEQRISTRDSVELHWLHRSAGARLADAVTAAEFPSGSVFAWLAGEAGMVRGLRRHLVEERGVSKRQIDFSGYWRATLTQDDAPTPEDLSDAQELLAQSQA